VIHDFGRTLFSLLEDSAGTGEIAAAAFKAAQIAFQRASSDPTLIHAFYLLTQIPLAARADDFAKALHDRGLPVSAAPSLFELLGAFGEAVDGFARQSAEVSVFGEMAQFAATESLTALGKPDTASLFGLSTLDLQNSLRKLSTTKKFGFLTRDFFSRLTRRLLSYYLNRELSNHVGPDRRFANIDAHTEFARALDLHCREASRIVEDFAGGWFSKTEFEGGIDTEKTRGFLHVAFKKVKAEMKAKGKGLPNGA